MQLQGFIRNTGTRSGKGKRPPYRVWTSYNAELHQDDGQKIAISFGFDRPEVGEGDYVKLDAYDKNGFLEVDQSTIERLDAPKQSTPAPAAVAQSGEVNTAPAAAGSAGDSSAGNYAVRDYNLKTNPEDARRITFAAASDRAVKIVALLLAHDALPHSKAKGKGGEAQRYQELMAAIDKVAVKLFHDAISLRTLDVVADEGVISVKPSSDLPADPENAEAKKASNAALDD